MIVARRTYTLADMVALPDDSLIYEILGGDLVVRNVPDIDHAYLIIEMILFLGQAQDAGFGFVFTDPRAVALDYPERGEAAEDVTHPDVFFLRSGREHLNGQHAVEGVPDLVVEMLSRTTRAEHRRGGAKWDAYERHGVPYYWQLDSQRRIVAQYSIDGEPYVAGRYGVPTILNERDVLTSPLFPSLTVPVRRVFRNVGRRYR